MVQPRLDYCSVLWSPAAQASIARLESVARYFTSQVSDLQDLDYWERLAALRLYSQERRRERYLIIFVWKIAMGLIQGYNIEFSYSPRRGWSAIPKEVPRTAPALVRRAREVI